MNRKFAVLGSPIEHSKSPLIHAAAYRVLGEDWEYTRHEVARGGLKRFIENDEGIHSGFSVTMPLKENAFQFAAETDELSKLAKASNTLSLQDGIWKAFNTDIFGITQAVSLALSNLKRESIRKSLVIGSGATCTSALVAISKLAPGSSVKIYARNSRTRAQQIDFASSLGLDASRGLFLGRCIGEADLTISTLPGGALDENAARFAKRAKFVPGGLLLDVAYHPWPSKLANFWSARNRPVVSGLEMLIWQAVAQIRIFKFGNPEQYLPNEIAVIEAMRNAVAE